jgi:hypothetical protein
MVDLGNVKMHTKSHTAVPLFVNLDDNYQPHPAGQGSPHKYIQYIICIWPLQRLYW